jgi:hypothetical protein
VRLSVWAAPGVGVRVSDVLDMLLVGPWLTDVLAELQLIHLSDALAGEDIESLTNRLKQGRPGLLQHLKECSVGTLSERQMLCNGLGRLARSGTVTHVSKSTPPLPLDDVSLKLYKSLLNQARLTFRLTGNAMCEDQGLSTFGRSGGALLILSNDRAARWSSDRASRWSSPVLDLQVVPAVMGAAVPAAVLRSMTDHARQTLTCGEMGILLSNHKAWRHAINMGWEWALILEDDATFEDFR